MREIKFRGKSITTGEWVYGDLIHEDLDFDTDKVYIRYNNKQDYKYDIVEVDPNTVGQYIRCKANGEEIYEGDIIKITAIALREVDVWDSKTGEYLGKKYTEEKIEEIKLVEWAGDGFNIIRNSWIEWHFEILGNKWENPELLKEV